MASKSQGSSTIKTSEYQLVEFIDGGTADFVPKWWVYFDVTQDNLVTKFMPPPYNDSTFKTLNILIRSKAPVEFPPVSDWPAYSVKLIGQAETFEEAEEKLKTFHALSRKSSIYTEDSDYSPDEKAKRIAEQYRNRSQVDVLNLIPIESDTSDNSFLIDTSWEENELKALAKKKKEKKSSDKKSEKPKKINKKSKKGKKKVYSSDENSSTNSDESHEFNNIAGSSLPEIKLPLTSTYKDREVSSPCPIYQKSINAGKKSYLNADHQNTNFGNKEKNSNVHKEVSPPCPTYQKSINPGKKSNFDADHQNMNITNKEKNSRPLLEEITHERKQNIRNESILKNFDNPTISTLHSSKQKDKDKKKYKNDSQDTRLILEKIKETNVEMSEIRNRLFRIEVMLEKLLSKNDCESKRGFIIDNELNVPFTNLNDFLQFDTKLCTDQQFRIDFISSLDVLMDSNFIVTKSILNILKRYLSKEVAMRFTNTKKSGDKLILKNYDFHRCIMDAVIQTHFNKNKSMGAVSEKAVLEAIGIVLANVKDWEGGRKERVKK